MVGFVVKRKEYFISEYYLYSIKKRKYIYRRFWHIILLIWISGKRLSPCKDYGFWDYMGKTSGLIPLILKKKKKTRCFVVEILSNKNNYFHFVKHTLNFLLDICKKGKLKTWSQDDKFVVANYYIVINFLLSILF